MALAFGLANVFSMTPEEGPVGSLFYYMLYLASGFIFLLPLSILYIILVIRHFDGWVVRMGLILASLINLLLTLWIPVIIWAIGEAIK